MSMRVIPLPNQSVPHVECPGSRRDFLARAGAGFGGLALASLLARQAPAAVAQSPAVVGALAPKAPHFPAAAKSVIWCFLDGGPSHLDLFDPKPVLNRLAGQPLPDSFERPVTAMGRTAYTPLMATKRQFAQHGQAGIWVSDWYPEIATCADDLAVIRSCHADGLNHVGGVCQMNTGSILGGRPSLGAWCLYGLGSECEDLPGYVVLADNNDLPPGGNRNWGTGFMPAAYQGTKFRDGKLPILHVAPPGAASGARQRGKLDFIQQLNRQHLGSRQEDNLLEARIASYELAFRMQAAAPEAIDLAGETAATRELYGLDQKETSRNGRNCLLARRLVERGRALRATLYRLRQQMGRPHRHGRQPLAALPRKRSADRRPAEGPEAARAARQHAGRLGRRIRPHADERKRQRPRPQSLRLHDLDGRRRRQGGVTYGATDEIGLYAVENKVHVNDIHATILHLLGIDHEQLTLLHNGRAERLTIVAGRVIKDILA